MARPLKQPHQKKDFVENHKIIFLARSQRSINLYRQSLLKSLASSWKIDKLGVFTFLALPWMWHAYKLLVTSDTVCNLICLKLSAPQLMILNGLGRYRNTRVFRGYLIQLINKKENIEICVQNYLDYRYLRKYVKRKICWIPGSGGTARETGTNESPVVITRDAKFQKQIHNLRNIETKFKKIHIVGLQKTTLDGENYVNWGRREQNSIFSEFKLLLQLDGYGEGIPHSLVDAICSNMDIYLTKRSWIQFGFYKLVHGSMNPKCDRNGFLLIKSNSTTIEELTLKLSKFAINTQYEKHISKYLNRG